VIPFEQNLPSRQSIEPPKVLFRFLETRRPGVVSALASKKQLDDALKTDIDAALTRVQPAARQRGITFHKEIEPLVVQVVADHLTMLIDTSDEP
jgi:hypothetical protein